MKTITGILLAALAATVAAQTPTKTRICDKIDPTRCAEVAPDGTIKVTTSAGGGATFGNAFPATGTAAGAKVVSGTPSYTPGDMEAPTLTTDGSLRISGSISASSSARANASAPTWVEGSDSPFSQDLAGWLRTRSLHTTAGSPLACRLSDGGSFLSVLPVSASSLPLPTGAASETTLSSLDGKVPSGLTVSTTRLLVDGSGVTQPVSGTLTCNAGSGTLAVSGPLTDGQLRATAVPVSGTFWQATQPVSASSLPLPSGASTESTLSTLSGKVPSGLTVTATRLLVDGSGVTQPVSGTVTATGTVTANVGTTGGLALDATLGRAQGSTTSGQTGPIIQGAVTTGSPSYTTGQTSPISLDTAGNLRVNVVAGGGSGGTSSSFGATFPGTGTAAGGLVVSSPPTYTNGNMEAPTLDTAGLLRVNVVAGGAGGGNAQLQVYDGAAWDNVGGAAESASLGHLPVKIQGTGANVIEPLNSTPGGSEYALPVRMVGGAAGDPSYTDATGTTVPANAAFVAGTDGTDTRAIKTDASGELQVDMLTAPSASATGAGVPAQATYLGASVGGTLTGLVATANGLKVDGSAVTQPVSGTVSVTGVATETTLSTLNGKVPSGLTVASTRLLTDGSGVTQPVSGTVTANLGTIAGVATETTLSSINTKTPALGQTTMAGSSPVTIASNQSAVPVSGTFWQATQPVSGTVTANAGTGTMAVSGPLTDTQLRATAVPVSQSGTWNVGTLTTLTSVTNAVTVAGQTAHSSAATGNAVRIGAYAEAEGAALDSSTVVEGDATRLKADIEGRLLVRTDHPFTWQCTRDAQSASGVCQASATAGYTIKDVLLSNGPTAQSIKVVYGTGTTCGTGTTVIVPTTYLGVNGGAVIPMRTPFRIPSTVDVCCVISGSTAHSCRISGERGP
jgi:hypothetical protein